jgi:4-amino-4-deoxy-L-arabinose transferase-like glycosyltransferase
LPFLRRASGEDLPGNGFQRAFAAAERGIVPYIILSAICLIVFGLGLSSLPPTDRDESRFMQATKQMIESGDYVHIRVQDTPRTKKPIGIHWLQAASVELMAQPLNHAWPYRVPSALGAWLAVLMTCACGRRLFGDRAGLVAGLMMATLPLTVAEAHLAKTDAMLLGLSTLAMAMLAEIYLAQARDQTKPSAGALVIFWLAIGAAMLVKGPVILLIAGATIATLAITDRAHPLVPALKLQWGLPLAILVVAPWLILLALNGEPGFIVQAVREDVLPKLTGGQESHGAAPGTYLVVTILTAWPWSLLIPVALVAIWPARALPAVRFCLAWLVPAWLAFEAIPTKLPHYILPLMPAAALLLGAAVQDGRRWRGVMNRPAGRGWRAVYLLISVSVGVFLLWAARTYGTSESITVAIAALGTLIIAGLTLIAGRLPPTPAVVVATAGAIVFCAVTVGGVLPQADRLWLSARVAGAIERHASEGPVSLVGFSEPSAIFLLGTETRLTDADGAATALAARPGSAAVVDAQHVEAVTHAVANDGGRVAEVAKFAGYDYARGQAMTLSVLISSK